MGDVDSAIYTAKQQAMAMPEGFHQESSVFSFCEERGNGCSALSDMFAGPADILIQQPFGDAPDPNFGCASLYFPSLRNSKYAGAAQELLLEFCSVGGGRAGGTGRNSAGRRSNSGDVPLPVSPADLFECQRKRSKLLSMLDEVERRYGQYCEQMEVVVKWMDGVMGCGAAWVYTWQARKAMSKHFRSVKDGIREQVRRTGEILGDEERTAETPRLSLIDQTLRQRRTFHQMAFHDHHHHPAWRPHRCLPDRSVSLLRAWLFQHFLHPYPSDADKHLLARQTGLTRNQVSNWFINARVRLWKPMVEDMYQQEANEEETQRQPKEEEDETNISHILSSAEASAQQQQQQQQTVTIPQNNSLSLTLGRFGP